MPTAPRTPADREEGVTAPEAQGGGLAPGHEALIHTGQQPGEVNLGGRGRVGDGNGGEIPPRDHIKLGASDTITQALPGGLPTLSIVLAMI